jgi:hypothetical protein
MKVLGFLLVLLLVPLVASAELAVCFNASRPLGSQFSHNPSVDPTKVTDPNCSVVTKASGQTASQLALINSTIRGAPAPKYLKVVSGLAVAMTTGEQDAVDADLAAKASAQQLFQDEATTQDFCSSATLAAVNTYLNNINASITTDIAAITNIATAQTAMTTMKTQFGLVIQKMARCLIALKKGAR